MFTLGPVDLSRAAPILFAPLTEPERCMAEPETIDTGDVPIDGPGGTEPSWIEIRLVDPKKNPVGHQPYLLTLPGGEQRPGHLAADGSLRHESIPLGDCFLELGDPTVLGADAESQADPPPAPIEDFEMADDDDLLPAEEVEEPLPLERVPGAEAFDEELPFDEEE